MKMTFDNLGDATQYIINISTAGATDITLDISKGNYIVRYAMSMGTLTKTLNNRKMLNGFPYNKTSPKPRLGYFR